MQWVYNFVILLYQIAFRLASFFHPKAKLAVEGRKNVIGKLKTIVKPEEQWIWMHCSSLGEFEQGRPVFDGLKQNYPEYKFALSFFSPSGYEFRKNYPLADYVFYLPFDTPQHAHQLAQIFRPKIWILVKYDYWYNHLKFQQRNGTKILVLSAIFRENQIYFKPWGGWLSTKLQQYIHHFFVQDQKSEELLHSIKISNVTVAGDTRFDRVKSIASATEKSKWVENFKGDDKLIVVGSSWKDDEDFWVKFINEELPDGWKVLLVPHEIKPEKINRLKKEIHQESLIYSELNISSDRSVFGNSKIVIVDAIGFLSRIYASANLAYVGGGFNKSGVHNTLEPAVFGIPVVIGPNFDKFNEVKLLKENKVIYSIVDYEEFRQTVSYLISDEECRLQTSVNATQVFNSQLPATEIILNKVDEILT